MKFLNTTKTHIKTLTLFILASLTFNQFHAQTWQWARSGNGSGSDYSAVSCTDPSGNIITTGQFNSNPLQMGTVTLNNSGASDAFIAKLNPNGTVLWAQKIGGTGSENITGVCSDASGNIYVHGSFNSSFITVSPFTVVNYTTSGTYDVFVACYNSSGVIQWFNSYGGAKNENSGGCAFSNSLSCLYIAGSFYSTSFTAGTNTLTNSDVTGNKSDIFLARITNTGSVTWAKFAGSSTSDDSGRQVAIDANSNPHYNGSFAPTSLTTTIGGTVITTYGGQDLLVVKYNSAGTPQWAKNFGSSINCSCDFGGGISIDASNNVFVGGTYTGASLVAGTFTITNSGGYDSFAAKTNSLGVFQWVTKIGGLGDQYTNALINDNLGNVFVTGSFSGTNVVVGSTTLTNGTPGTSTDIYVLKLNNSGTSQWAVSATGANTDEQGNDISADATGNIYVSGVIYTSPTVFGSTTLTSSGANDIFLAKLSCLTTSIGAVSPVCSGSSTTLSATGATSYTWSNGATGFSIVISPSISTTYSVVGSIGTCTGTGNSINVSVLPASINAGPDFSLTCAQQQLISAVTTPSNPTSVVWSPTTGLSNSSVLTPTATAGSTVNHYTVTATLNNGCVVKDYINVSSYAPTPQLCMVTVDSLGVNNEIYWDKTMYSHIDSFIVYREVSTGVYKRIATLNKTSYSMFTDTSRSVGPANGDPNTTSYKYKLQLRDSCGNYSAMSPYHQTIFVQDQQNGNFNWNSYAIEGASSPVTNYYLKRQDLSTGASTIVSSTTSNLITDPLYSSLFATNIKWYIDAQGFNCNPSFRISNVAALKTRTKSNSTNEKIFPTIVIPKNSLTTEQVDVFPNPTTGILTLNFKGAFHNGYYFEIKNVLGQIVYTENNTSDKQTLNLTNLNKGIYFLSINHNSTLLLTKKIIID